MTDYTNEKYLESETTNQIINAAWEVYNYFGGAGFTENIYETALELELKLRGMKVERQCPIKVYYKGHLVGDFKADLVVGNVILELKAVSDFHEVQLVNYLKATEIEIGLLLNFGDVKKLGIKRKIFSNNRKRQQNRIPK